MATTTIDKIVDEVTSHLHDLLVAGDVFDPEFLARTFWEFDSKKQADFFNYLARFCDEQGWSAMQWRYMQDDLRDGKRIIDEMKDHTDKEAA